MCLCLCDCSWWVGEWQKCSASCGSSGLAKRTVLCIQAVSVEEQEALQASECEHIPKPESLSSCNTHIPCPADWTAGSWSKVSPRQDNCLVCWELFDTRTTVWVSERCGLLQVFSTYSICEKSFSILETAHLTFFSDNGWLHLIGYLMLGFFLSIFYQFSCSFT